MEIFEIPDSAPLFCGLERAPLEALLLHLNPRRLEYARGAVIMLAGEPAGEIGIVLHGRACVVREGLAGDRMLLTRLCAGEMFAEAYACAGAKFLPVSVIAAEPCAALLFSAHKLLHPCTGKAEEARARAAENLIRVLAQKSMALNRRLAHLSRRSTREKLLSYFSDLAIQQGRSFEIPLSRQELADFLCVDRSAMSAVISRMQRDGEIAVRGRNIELLLPGRKTAPPECGAGR